MRGHLPLVVCVLSESGKSDKKHKTDLCQLPSMYLLMIEIITVKITDEREC